MIPSVTISGDSINYFIPKEEEEPAIQYIERWIMGDKEVCLQRQEDHELLNNISGQTIKVPIDLGKLPIDFVIFALSRSQPEVKSGGVIVPEPPLISHFKWVFRNKEVQLLQKDSKNLKQETGLIWQLFDTSTRTISQAPFSAGFSLQDWFKGEAWIDDRNPPNYVSMKNMLGGDLGLASCFFQDHDIVKLEMQPTPYSLTHRLSAVYAKKIKKRSELDPSVFIDYDSWKITLINFREKR